MKTKVPTRLARLAGLLLVLSIVFAAGAQAALATLASSSGAGTGPAVSTQVAAASSAAASSVASTAQIQGLTAAQRHHFIGPSLSVVAVTPLAGTQGRGGVALSPFTPAQSQGSTVASRNIVGHFQPVANALPAQPASTAASSTSAWIAAGSFAAIVLIGLAAWALTRRRQPGARASAAYCAEHPEDAMCRAV